MAGVILKAKKLITKTFKNVAGQTEDEFYTSFFTQNPHWNKATPNADENLRWKIIEKFLYYIKGYQKSTGRLNSNNILDMGCGRGWLSNLLANYGHVIAIEPVRPVVEHARKLFPHLDIRCGTAGDLVADGKLSYFDVIVCSEVIEHIPDAQKADFIFALKSLLKKGGFLMMTTPRKDAEAEWIKYGNAAQPVEDWMTEKALGSLFEQAGLTNHLLSRAAMPPVKKAPEIEIYQLWLVQN